MRVPPINVVDLGGGPRNDKLENGVVYYFHDSPGTGKMLEVASIRFPALIATDSFKPVSNFTGKDVLAASVDARPFPQLLDPVDDLPPATIIQRVSRRGGGWIAQGVSQDNGTVASIQVNGRPAIILSQHHGIADWEATIDAADKTVTAVATDAAGNVEKTPATCTR